MPRIKCVVVTPEQTALERPVDFVALPLYDGEIGIAYNHSPLIGRLGYGELRLRDGEAVARYYVDGGFVQVADNSVTILTNRAVPAEKIDLAEAEEQLRTSAARPANTPELLDIRNRLVGQARGQLRVARSGH